MGTPSRINRPIRPTPDRRLTAGAGSTLAEEGTAVAEVTAVVEAAETEVFSAMPDGTALAVRLREGLDLGPESPRPARKPGHRVPFVWPPHPVSYGFGVKPTDWTETSTIETDGARATIRIARTEHGVFGRWEEIWLEARGASEEEMRDNLCKAAQPYLHRQRKAATALGIDGRMRAPISALDPLSLLRLLYCEDRDVAREATDAIETRGGSVEWTEAFIVILTDRRHEWRRIAQWCVLDLCERLAGIVPDLDDQSRIVPAIAGLLTDAEDDFARAIFKAGTVLGGHFPAHLGEKPLLDALERATPIGRRAAIHGLFHVAEWEEAEGAFVAAALRAHADRETEPLLAEYARGMADDVESAEPDHVAEPKLPHEP